MIVNGPHLMPHAVCWAGAPRLIWTMVAANFVTFVSYSALCGTLLYIARRTFRVISGDWVWFVVGFALFIVACGTTHLMDIVTTWNPIFWVAAAVSVVTAVLSAYVAVMLMRRAGGVSFAINDYAQRLLNTQEEKDRMRDQLMAARKMEDWSRMSAVISHEISQPLELIGNLLYLIRSEAVSEETRHMTRQAQEEVGRVITISRSMLQFHRESVVPEMVSLRQVAESVQLLLQNIIRHKRIHFEIEAWEDVSIEAFPGETRQVVLNLARNACEATAEESTVRLRFTPRGHGVQFEVTDQGSGIADTVVPYLFDFGRTTKGKDGNGLGLWTVKQIVSKHGGTIYADTRYKRGARFVVWWPKQYRSAESGLTAEVSHPASQLAGFSTQTAAL